MEEDQLRALSDEDLLRTLTRLGGKAVRTCQEKQAAAGSIADDPRWSSSPLPLRFQSQVHVLFLGALDAFDAVAALLDQRASQQAFGMIRFEAETLAMVRWLSEPADEETRTSRAYGTVEAQLERWQRVLERDAARGGPPDALDAPKRVEAVVMQLNQIAREDGYAEPLPRPPGRRQLFDNYLPESGWQSFAMYSELGSHPGAAGNLLFALDLQDSGKISFGLGGAFRQRAFWSGAALHFLLLVARQIASALDWNAWLESVMLRLVEEAAPYLNEAARRQGAARDDEGDHSK